MVYLKKPILTLIMNETEKNTLINSLKDIYRFYPNQYHELQVINDNYNTDDILNIEIELDHDGYDSFGPKSDLWDLIIIHKKNGKKYKSIWHREEWFIKDVDEQYGLWSQEIINQ